MTLGIHPMPGTVELAKNLLAAAKTATTQAVGTPDPIIVAAMLQALTTLHVSENTK